MPNNFGNCVLARNSATPHLKPVITLSEMKLTIEPALTSQAMKAMSATSKAVPAASALNRVVSPPAIPPNDAPTSSEMAEVTVMAVCRELQKQPEDQAAKQARVESRLGRQVGQRGVAEPGGQEICRQRDAGDDVTPQPGLVVMRSQPRAGSHRETSPATWAQAVSLTSDTFLRHELPALQRALRRRRRPSSSASGSFTFSRGTFL